MNHAPLPPCTLSRTSLSPSSTGMQVLVVCCDTEQRQGLGPGEVSGSGRCKRAVGATLTGREGVRVYTAYTQIS